MQKDSLEFLKALIDTPSPSGFEQPAQELYEERVRPYVDDIRKDVHGNVIAVRNADAGCRVMLAGHCDEIGLMVKHINDQGFLYVASIGGVDTNLLPGMRVTVHTTRGPVLGVIGRTPIHLLEKEDLAKAPKLHELWVDIGAKDRKDAEKVVSPGDPITFNMPLRELRNGLVTAHGFDDKAGVFVVAETLRLLAGKKLSVAVYGVSTVQEELGLRGATTSAFGVNPQVGIAVDVEFAADSPGDDKRRIGEVSLGKGPVLNRGANTNPVLGKMLIDTARRKKLPHQLAGYPRATGTDANAIQITRSGVAASLVGVPNRYMHTAVEIVSLNDLENAARLLAAFISELDPKTDFTP